MIVVSPRVGGEAGGISPLTVAGLGVLVLVVTSWASGPLSFSVDRQRAATAADATALAAVGWGEAVAHRVAQANGATLVNLEVTPLRAGSVATVTVEVDGVSASARATDAG